MTAVATRMRGVHRVHFVGIGGAGMSGIAEVLLLEGYEVTGSDLATTAATERLATLGAFVRVGHAAAAIDGPSRPDVVVTSSAVAGNNPEVERARELGIAVIPRAQMLGELMRHRTGIAVAGSHGKSTTASMIAALLLEAGRDPTYVIGARLVGGKSGAGLGGGAHMIAEADESDASFLHLHPSLAVVTNIDRDHLEAYGHDFAQLRRAFVNFVHRLPFYGICVLESDGEAGTATEAEISRPLRTFGFAQDADYRAILVSPEDGRMRFRVRRPMHSELDVVLAIPGRHNVKNALAAIAVATEEDIDDDAILRGLASFRGVARRFERSSERIAGRRVTLVDDYGHHPAELAQVIATARTLWPTRRLVMAYQPHRYTRTRDLFEDFVQVLGQVDSLVLLDVYAAGEPALPEVAGDALARAVCRSGDLKPGFAAGNEQAAQLLRKELEDDDVLLVQGAGDIERLPAMLRAPAGEEGGDA